MALANATNRQGGWFRSPQGPLKTSLGRSGKQGSKSKSKTNVQTFVLPGAENAGTPINGVKAFDTVLSPTQGQQSVERRAGKRRSLRGMTPQRRAMPTFSPPRDLVFSSDEEDEAVLAEARHERRKSDAASAAAAATPKKHVRRAKPYIARAGHGRSSGIAESKGNIRGEDFTENEAKRNMEVMRTPHGAAVGRQRRSVAESKAADTPGDFKSDFDEGRAITITQAGVHQAPRRAPSRRSLPIDFMEKHFIVRDRSGMNRLFPSFRLYAEVEGAPPKLLFVARKQKACRGTNYHIFRAEDGVEVDKLNKNSNLYEGKLRVDPKDSQSFTLFGRPVVQGSSSVQPQLAAIRYLSRGDIINPRQAQVLLPQQTGAGVGMWMKQRAGETLLDRLKAQRCGDMLYMQNKRPEVCGTSYRLNFYGRVKVPSIKNFQLEYLPDCDHAAKPELVLQCGKIDDDTFIVDFMAPCTGIQSFAIALSQFCI